MSTLFEAVKKGIAFIENNLKNEIGVSDVANAVSYSQFYFSREFSKSTHISIYDYIQRRKLSESYKELFHSKSKIVDLAYRYGFQSHEVYTRSFRKVFGENPSEVSQYKPLAVYEAIDDTYLDFLSDLRIEITDRIIGDCRFEVSGVTSLSEPESKSCVLVLFSPQNPFCCSCVFKGNFSCADSDLLSFQFSTLSKKIRIHHFDRKLAFRYYMDYFYDPNEMNSNYILLLTENSCIDIVVPMVHRQQQ